MPHLRANQSQAAAVRSICNRIDEGAWHVGGVRDLPLRALHIHTVDSSMTSGKHIWSPTQYKSTQSLSDRDGQ
jgi:hypothetical protein